MRPWETNEALARQRAQAVANRLKPQANRTALVEVEIAAASHPLATNATADGRAANRRVDVILHSQRRVARAVVGHCIDRQRAHGET